MCKDWYIDLAVALGLPIASVLIGQWLVSLANEVAK